MQEVCCVGVVRAASRLSFYFGSSTATHDATARTIGETIVYIRYQNTRRNTEVFPTAPLRRSRPGPAVSTHEMRFLTNYGSRLPDDVLRKILLSVANIRQEAALSITCIFRRIGVLRAYRVRRITNALFANEEGGQIHIGNFMDIYGITPSGQIVT